MRYQRRSTFYVGVSTTAFNLYDNGLYTHLFYSWAYVVTMMVSYTRIIACTYVYYKLLIQLTVFYTLHDEHIDTCRKHKITVSQSINCCTQMCYVKYELTILGNTTVIRLRKTTASLIFSNVSRIAMPAMRVHGCGSGGVGEGRWRERKTSR